VSGADFVKNVYPAEVENALLQIEGVAASAVIGVSDSRWGETGLAVICTRPGVTLTRDAIIANCKARLAHFKQPRDVVFVDALPLTASGKINKPSLRAGLEEAFGLITWLTSSWRPRFSTGAGPIHLVIRRTRE
jgi:acyl-CoA synthetase (AMP-forming)/AMP-acid ligase II